jgi:ribonuclease HI
LESYNLIVYTDGSGHEDGYSGYAAFIKTPDGLVKRFVMGAMSVSSVDRAEFTALIEGLRVAYDLWKTFPEAWQGHWPEEVVLRTPRIMWYSDRESLVLSVKRVYARDNCRELWSAFEYFEQNMVITAEHITSPVKDEMPEFVECDLQSSTCRDVIKHLYLATPLIVDADLAQLKLAAKASADLKKNKKKS